MARYLVLSDNSLAVVDDDVYDDVARWRWKRTPRGYIHRNKLVNGLNTSIYLSRYIMAAELAPDPALEVDHLDQDKSNNRRSNLAVRPAAEHYRRHRIARPPQPGKLKGVYWRSSENRWYASITVGGKVRHLGCWPPDQLEAAIIARDLAALREYGSGTYLNRADLLQGREAA